MVTSTTAETTGTPPGARRPARARRVAELRALAGTTPGVLIRFLLAVVATALLAGVLSVVAVQDRARTLGDLADRSGPLSVAAQDIYRALSDADATGNGGFLARGQEPAAVRARYDADIARAEAALTVAVAAREPADVADPANPLAVLSAKLSVYTGLIETARANNLQGLPVGAAYQREASNLMRTELLPAAEALHRQQAAARSADQEVAAGSPWIAAVVGIVLIVVLVVAQRYLRRHSRRRLNPGLLVATVAAVISLLWVLGSALVVAADVDAGRDTGSAQADVLSRARVAAGKARGDETLTLVARGNGARFEQSYRESRAAVDRLLAEAAPLATDSRVAERITAARDAEAAWYRAHRRIRALDDGGDFDGAVRLALGTGPGDAAGEFDRVDTALSAALAETNAAFTDEVGHARTALTGVTAGVIALTAIAAVAGVAGIWQRLKEYR